MEPEDEKFIAESSSNPLSDKTLTILTTTSLGLGLGLGFLYALNPQTLKPVSTAIKVSEAALKGSKSLSRIRSPSSILFFSKTLIKISSAVSKRFNHSSPSLDSKRIKAYIGVFNLVRYLQFPPVVGNGFLELGVLGIGYKLSKNFMKVLEGFFGVELDSALRKGVDAVELLVKTTVVTREVSKIATLDGWKERLEIEEGDGDSSDAAKHSACRVVRKFDLDCGVCLNFERIDCNRCDRCSCSRFDCWCLGSFDLDFIMWEGDFNGEERLESCLADLLCLSIPVKFQYQFS